VGSGYLVSSFNLVSEDTGFVLFILAGIPSPSAIPFDLSSLKPRSCATSSTICEFTDGNFCKKASKRELSQIVFIFLGIPFENL